MSNVRLTKLNEGKKMEYINGNKSNPVNVYDVSEGFDVARERNRPVYVRVETTGELMHLFPSGYGKDIKESKHEG